MQTMALIEYIADPARRTALASNTSSSPDYLWQIATGWNGKRAGHDLAMRIEAATDGAVRCDDLRPDVLWNRDDTGRVIGYQVRIAPPARRPRKKVTADKSPVHGEEASSKRRTLKSPRVAGPEVGHG